MQKNAIAIIYRREFKGTTNNLSTYNYVPDDLVVGFEYEGYGKKKFFDTKENIEFAYIEDTTDFESEYVYAFPNYTDDLSQKKQKSVMERMIDEFDKLDEYSVFQVYEESDPMVKTYATSDCCETCMEIDTSNYLGCQDMLSKNYDKLKKRQEEKMGKVQINVKNINVAKINQSEPEKRIYAKDIFDEVTKTVRCQDDQVKQISTCIVKNSMIKDPELKANMLICGPTGVGKTEILRQISTYMDLPLVIEDATQYTMSGYAGHDVDEILLHLLKNAEWDTKKAERGIISIDEIDKKASNKDVSAIATNAVIDSLLKMMEGHVYELQTSGRQGPTYTIDTSYINFIFAGAFSGIEKYVDKEKIVGFKSEEKESVKDKYNSIYSNESLKKYGIDPQFIGRNGKIIIMNNLGVDELIQIMLESQKSYLNLNIEFYKQLSIKLICEDDAITKIAQRAHEKGVGARGIRVVLEKALEVAEYYVLSENHYKELIITEETIDDPKKYILR